RVSLGLAPRFVRTIDFAMRPQDKLVWAATFDVENLPHPKVDPKHIPAGDHNAGGGNTLFIDRTRNELYLPGRKVVDAVTGKALGDFQPKFVTPISSLSVIGEAVL